MQPVKICFSTLTIALLLWPLAAAASNPGSEAAAEQALVRLAVDHIDSVLEGVAASTGAVAEEFAIASRAVGSTTEEQTEYWRTHHLVRGNTVLFQTWPGKPGSPPGYQADAAASLSYRGEDFSGRTVRELELFRRLTPVVRAAWRAYPFSWSYLTTADDGMLIYPFLTLDQAVNNDPPTRQTYYLSADFEHRTAGWTAPYLDLVGAGMMVTVSTPAYDGDTLLGVVSHDITLAQLSEKVLHWVTRDVGGTAWLVDDTGLVIGVSDPALARELDETNTAAGAAVLHYRSKAWRQNVGPEGARVSRNDRINELTGSVIDRMTESPDAGAILFERDRQAVCGARSEVAGWYLVWMAGENRDNE